MSDISVDTEQDVAMYKKAVIIQSGEPAFALWITQRLSSVFRKPRDIAPQPKRITSDFAAIEVKHSKEK